MPLGRIQGEITRQTFLSPTVRWTPEKLNVNDQLSISQTEIPTSLQEAWNAAHQDLLERLESSVTLNKFRDARLVAWTSSEDDSLTLDIEVQGDFIAQWVRVRHVALLAKLVADNLDTNADNVRINLVVRKSEPAATRQAPTRIQAKRPAPEMLSSDGRSSGSGSSTKSVYIKPNLNRAFTFETLVRGKANQLAASCAAAICESPGEIYNPMFLYGPSGNGKTHTLHAIGHAVQQRHPELRVGYVSGEAFLTEFLESLRENRTAQFRKKFRQLDVLLVDDIQFLGGREATVEEFFHTFNTLQQSGRALVIASDRAPRDLPGMDERIRTRLAAGMVAQLASPELELRIAILQSKLMRDQAGHMVPLNVLEYIAQCVTSSVRALEGALVRLLAMAGCSGEPITIDLAKDALIDIADNAPVAPLAVYGHTIRPIPPHKLVGILQDVLEETLHIDRAALVGTRRDRPTVQARHIAMYLIRDMTGASLAAIGDVFGGKDHTSVRHACEKVQLAMNTETAYMQQVQQLRNKVTLRLTSRSLE